MSRRSGLLRVPAVAGTTLRLSGEAAGPGLARTLALQVLAAAITAAQLFVVKELAAGLIRLSNRSEGSIGDVVPELIALAAVTLVSGATAAVLASQQRLLAEQVARRSVDLIVDVVSASPLARLENPAFHDHLERALAAAMSKPTELVSSLLAVVLGLLTSVAVVVVLVTLEPLLPLLIVAAAVPVLLTGLRNSARTYDFEVGMSGQARERLHLLELLTDEPPAKELRVFDAIAALRRRYDALSDERISRVESFLRVRTRSSVLAAVGTALGTVLALAVLVLMLASGRIDLTTATVAAVAMQLLAGRLVTAITALSRLVEASLFIDDLQRFYALARRDGLPPTQDRSVDPLPLADLTVSDLRFTYPGTEREVLRGIDLQIPAGQTVAIVGENGSGKTTLVKLLCRLYDDYTGSIRWGETDVANLDARRLRSSMTVLFQDFIRYHLTAGDNIWLGRPELGEDRDRATEAARRAGASELLDALADGLDTRLGREFFGGSDLSGGQWQRLAIARAFYRGGGLLILDEPTAALDARAEHDVFEEIQHLRAGRSVLLISHRFANVRSADRIYVLEAGRIVQAGTHRELIAEPGLYAELYAMQAAGFADDGGTES